FLDPYVCGGLDGGLEHRIPNARQHRRTTSCRRMEKHPRGQTTRTGTHSAIVVHSHLLACAADGLPRSAGRLAGNTALDDCRRMLCPIPAYSGYPSGANFCRAFLREILWNVTKFSCTCARTKL